MGVRFEDLNVKPGDVVEVVADCAANGVRVSVPRINQSNYTGHVGGKGAWVKNIEGAITAYHTGQCWGDPDRWILVQPNPLA